MTFMEARPGSVSPGVPLGREWQQTVYGLCLPPWDRQEDSALRPVTGGGGAEASRGSPLAPGENRIGASGRVLIPWTQAGGTGNSSRNSRGLVTSWPRTPPASCSNLGRDDARPLLRRDHRISACRFSAKSTPYHGGLRSRAWAFQMGWSQMTESGSTATPQKNVRFTTNM